MMALSDLVTQGNLEFSDGYRTKSNELAQEGFRIVRAGDIREGRVFLDGPDSVAADFRSALGEKVARTGDVVLTTKGTVGRVALMRDMAEPVVYSPQVCYFRFPLGSAIDRRYFYYWLHGQEFRRQAGYLMESSDMAPYISLRDLASIKFSVRPLDFQLAAGEALGALDDKILASDQLVSLYRSVLRAEFEALCQSNQARLVRLTTLAVLNPRVPKPSDREVRYLDMQKLPISGWGIRQWVDRGEAGGSRFQNGDTLLARITPCLENGKLGYVDFLDDDEVGFGSTEFVVMRPKEGVPRPLPYLIAASDSFRDYAIQHMYGTSGRQRVVAKDLEEYELSLPPLEDMADFGRRAEAVFDHAGALRDESRTLAALRDTLLPALMSGRLTVRDAEAAVSEVA